MGLNCVYTVNIPDELRGQIIAGKLDAETSKAAFFEDLRGVAMLELGFVDIELNVETGEWRKDGDECEPFLNYFVCVRRTTEVNGFDDGWESYEYADLCLSEDDAKANIDWSDENWRELLFRDMLDSLLKFVNRNAQDNLCFLSPNVAENGPRFC
jgi:hypothetical protein